MDNKFYRIDISKFDPTNASAEDIRKWLFAIIDAELEKKPEERDYVLIEECSDFEAELPSSDIELSESDYVAGLERMKAQTSVTEHKETKILKPKKKTKKSIRIIAILAASLATLMLSLSVAAAVQGKPVIQFISDSFKTILGMDSGDKLNNESITLIKDDALSSYSSLEEAVMSTGYNVLYPSYLPNGVSVERIFITYLDSSGAIEISYVTNDANLLITAYESVDLSHMDWENSILHRDATIDFYIIKTIDGSYQATGVYNNMRYSIKYTDYDELINILNGMKEIVK